MKRNTRMVVIPGLRQRYMDLVRENLRHFGGWTCRAYSAETLTQWPPQCDVEIHRGWKWASMLNLTQLGFHTHILVLLDDVRIPLNFCMSCFLRDSYGTSVTSPIVLNATWPTTRGSRCQSTRCNTNFIETYMKLFTLPALHCYFTMFDWSVLRDNTQAVGWGYDRCFKAACPRFKQRLFRSYQIEHVATSGGLGYLAHIAYPQSIRLQAWTRSRFNRPCLKLGSV